MHRKRRLLTVRAASGTALYPVLSWELRRSW